MLNTKIFKKAFSFLMVFCMLGFCMPAKFFAAPLIPKTTTLAEFEQYCSEQAPRVNYFAFTFGVSGTVQGDHTVDPSLGYDPVPIGPTTDHLIDNMVVNFETDEPEVYEFTPIRVDPLKDPEEALRWICDDEEPGNEDVHLHFDFIVKLADCYAIIVEDTVEELGINFTAPRDYNDIIPGSAEFIVPVVGDNLHNALDHEGPPPYDFSLRFERENNNSYIPFNYLAPICCFTETWVESGTDTDPAYGIDAEAGVFGVDTRSLDTGYNLLVLMPTENCRVFFYLDDPNHPGLEAFKNSNPDLENCQLNWPGKDEPIPVPSNPANQLNTGWYGFNGDLNRIMLVNLGTGNLQFSGEINKDQTAFDAQGSDLQVEVFADNHYDAVMHPSTTPDGEFYSFLSREEFDKVVQNDVEAANKFKLGNFAELFKKYDNSNYQDLLDNLGGDEYKVKYWTRFGASNIHDFDPFLSTDISGSLKDQNKLLLRGTPATMLNYSYINLFINVKGDPGDLDLSTAKRLATITLNFVSSEWDKDESKDVFGDKPINGKVKSFDLTALNNK